MTKRLAASFKDLPEFVVERIREWAATHDVEPALLGDYSDNTCPDVLEGLEPKPHS